MIESTAAEAAIVYVVDDDKMARDSLSWLLSSVGIEVRGFEQGAAFLTAASSSMAGCVLLDMRMPGIDGLETHRRLVAKDITMPVVLMTGHADVPMALRALRAGVFEFIEKPYNDQLMIEQVQRALEFDYRHRRASRRSRLVKQRFATLSPREQQVLRGVLAGQANKVIAAQLHISIKTVELHRANMMSKVQAESLVSLVRMAIAAGIDTQDADRG